MLLLLFLAGSIWLNGWLALKVMDYKGRLFLAHEFPDESTATILNDPKRLDVWLVGDSRIAAWTIQDTATFRFVNRGVSGFTAKDALARLKLDLAGGSRPDVVVIQAGINDVLSAGYNRPSRLPVMGIRSVPNRPSPDEILEGCALALQQIVDISTAAGASVVLLKVFPPGPKDWRDVFFWDEELHRQLDTLNSRISQIQGNRLSTVDPASALATGGRTLDAYSANSIHLNEKGYEILDMVLASELAKISRLNRPAE
jgi:lysophospholipase L1-like esterase